MGVARGGSSSNGNAINNTVIIDGGVFNGGSDFVYGGSSSYEDAIGNTVIFNSCEFSENIVHQIFGGYSSNGNATDNMVTINGGNITSVYGGYGGNARDNIVTVNNGTIYHVRGGSSGNTVIINNGVISGQVEGGYYSNNTVIINGGTFKHSGSNYMYDGVCGAYAIQNDVTGNTVTINGGNFSYRCDVYGGYSIYGNSTDNTVNIYGSPDLTYSYLYGGKGVISSGNTLNVYTKGLTARNIYDFQNINFYLPESIVNGDTILNLTESNTDISGAAIKAGVVGNANLNTGDVITLLQNNGTITTTGTIYSTLTEGVSLNYDLTVKKDGNNKILAQIGGSSEEPESEPQPEPETEPDSEPEPEITIVHDSNNVVNIYSSDSGTIYGGNTDTGDAKNNIVNLYGGTNLENIYGGYAPSGSTSGNTLNVRAKGLTANNIYNFDNLNFYIPKDAINGDTLLTLTDTNGTNLSGFKISAGVVAGNSNLQIGDTINLLTNSNGLTTTSVTTYGTLIEGVSLNYDMNISHAGNSIVANITQSPNNLNPETESLPLSSGIPAIETVNTSFDTPTIDENKEDANALIVDSRGWEVFANMGGGSLKVKGSDVAHVDMTSQSINLGFARSLENSPSSLIIAPVFDYVSSNYDSYLEMGTHGSGKTRYIAGGLLARRMLPNGFYYEGSVRVGKVKTDFASDNLDKTGVFGRVTYDASATTLVGHLKIGKAFRLNKNNFLDVYGVYYHAHQGGMNADLSSGEHYNFSSANSGRFRIGYRLTTKTSNISKIYTGLAYQYEHSSGVTATYKNYSTAGTGNSGSSGMLEVGWIIKPLKALPWAVDINTTGWIGHQRGITAMAKIQKAF